MQAKRRSASNELAETELMRAANCGETADLLRCSRCHAACFCSRVCQKVYMCITQSPLNKQRQWHTGVYRNLQWCLQAYWPFHRAHCHRNEFADATEDNEPKFASWMRSHGKLAVLKDDEVDRLERAGAATMGPTRGEVLESMYNKLDPKPQGIPMLRSTLLSSQASTLALSRNAFPQVRAECTQHKALSPRHACLYISSALCVRMQALLTQQRR